MEDVHLVQMLEPFDNLDKDFPDFCLLEKCALRFVTIDLLIQVASISILHDNAESFWIRREESFFVGDYVWVSR